MNDPIKIQSRSSIINYAKGWYERNETIYDLAILMTDIYLLNVVHIKKGDIRTNMIQLCFDVGIFDNDRKFFDFMTDISPENYFKNIEGPRDKEGWYFYTPHPDYDFDRAVIMKCLRMLAMLAVKDKDGNLLIDYEEPNYNILRKKQDEK